MKKQNHYTYNDNTSKGTNEGAFNIYQARNGGIALVLGDGLTFLTIQNLQDLKIDVTELKDFDTAEFRQYYKITHTFNPPNYQDTKSEEGAGCTPQGCTPSSNVHSVFQGILSGISPQVKPEASFIHPELQSAYVANEFLQFTSYILDINQTSDSPENYEFTIIDEEINNVYCYSYGDQLEADRDMTFFKSKFDFKQ